MENENVGRIHFSNLDKVVARETAMLHLSPDEVGRATDDPEYILNTEKYLKAVDWYVDTIRKGKVQ